MSPFEQEIESFVIKSCYKYCNEVRAYVCPLINNNKSLCKSMLKNGFHLNNARKHIKSKHNNQFLDMLKNTYEKCKAESIDKKLNIPYTKEFPSFISVSITKETFDCALVDIFSSGLAYSFC